MHNQDKVINTDEGIFVLCEREGVYKPSSLFLTSSTKKGVYYKNCSECGDFNYKVEQNKIQASKEFLEGLGYDTSKDIHTQFLERNAKYFKP